MRLPTTGLKIGLGILCVYAALAASEAWAQLAADSPLETPLPSADEKIPEIADATARFNERDFDGTLELLGEAADKYPSRLPPRQVMMYLLLAKAKQASAALAALESAVVEDPDDPQAYLILAESELRGGRVTPAALLYEKAHGLMESFTKSPARKEALEPIVYAGLASVAEYRALLSEDDPDHARQEWIAAEEYFQAWLDRDPKNINAMMHLAQAMFRQKTKEKVNAANEMLKAAKALDPQNVLNPAARLALFYQAEGDYAKAKQWMDYALQSEPDDLATLLTAADWCLQTSLEDPNQLEEAWNHAVKANVADPDSLMAMIMLGGVALFQKKYETAERHFTSAHVQDPGSFAATNNLALALCEQPGEKKERALAFARNNARQYTQGRSGIEAASTYGWVLYRNGLVAEADNILSQLTMSTSVSLDTLYYAAQVAYEQQRPEEAKRLLKHALGANKPFYMRPEAVRLEEQLRRPGSSR
jgi:tetratricopeptide (TPR) repeat protein